MMVKSILLVIAAILSIVLAAPTNVTGALTFPFMGHALEARSSSDLAPRKGPCLDCKETCDAVENGSYQTGDREVCDSLCDGDRNDTVSFPLLCSFHNRGANEDKVRAHELQADSRVLGGVLRTGL